jgi:signal transduction histidine kinase/PAS domain-containing protein
VDSLFKGRFAGLPGDLRQPFADESACGKLWVYFVMSRSPAEQDAFLLSLNDRIRVLTEPHEIMTTAAEALARFLDIAAAGYAEMEDDENHMLVGGEFGDGRMRVIKGRLRLTEFGAGFAPLLRAGRGAFAEDMTNDPRAEPGGTALIRSWGIRGAGAAPLVRNDKLVACLYATHHEPRPWPDWEQRLFDQVAERTRAAVAQARAEKALRDSEDKYRTILTSMDEGFMIGEVLFDDRGVAQDVYCLEANPAFYAHSGITEKVAGRRLSEASTVNPPPWLPAFGKTARTRVPIRFDHHSANRGESRYYNVHVLPIGDPGMNRIAVLFRNITEEKRREKNLAFLSEIQDDLSRLTTADEIMNSVGRKICAYLDVAYAYFVQVDETKDEARPRYIFNKENVPPLPAVFPLSAYITPEFRRMARAGEPLIVRDTGHDIRTNAEAYASRQMGAFIAVPFLKQGDWRFTLSVCDSNAREWTRDEIELVVELANRVFPRMERALAEQVVAEDLRDTRLLRELGAKLVSEQQLQALYEEILAAAITLTHADAGTVQLLNAETQVLSIVATRGFTPEVTAHFASVDARSGTSCGKALANNERTFVDFDAPGCESNEDRRLHVEAGYRTAQSTPLLTRAGVPLGMVSTHWKEHEHRPAERQLRFLDLLARQASDLLELRRNENDLKKADRLKDEFIAMLAHELRNPLAPVRTGLELIRAASDSPDAIERVRSMMTRQVSHMVRLIDDLLDVSRITSGKIRLQRQSTPLAALVSTAIEANRDALNSGRVDLQVDLPREPAVVDVDPTRFVQVVSNLLQNAVKFTDPGGRVRLAAEFKPSLDGGAREFVLSVSDSGIGIAKEALSGVFDLFTQGESSSERAKGGLGIGLALSRRLMELHGGSIEVTSGGTGAGSVFTIRLPMANAAPELAAAAEPVVITPKVQRRAVVIDDNKDAADTTAMLVSAMGGEVRVAYDGESGVREVLAFRPDVVFLDIGMPGIDGYETCRRIRRQATAQPMIVALTGWGQDQDVRETKRAGFDRHLTKPADPLILQKLLVEVGPVAPAS